MRETLWAIVANVGRRLMEIGERNLDAHGCMTPATRLKRLVDAERARIEREGDRPRMSLAEDARYYNKLNSARAEKLGLS